MRTLAPFVLAGLIGCASPIPQETFYLLRSEAPDRVERLEPPLRIGLGRISVAPYLDRTGLVVETDAHQIRTARYHHWAEPLDQGLRSFLRSEISRALGYAVSAGADRIDARDFRVDVAVDVLHGSLSGNAWLSGSWRVTRRPGGEEVGSYGFSRSVPLARGGYAGLVDAEIDLLEQLASAIAESLRGLHAERAAR